MSEIRTTDLQKVVSALKKSDRKYLSLEDLSKIVGLYSDTLGTELSFFEPMVLMDSSLNMKNLLGPAEAYLAKKEEARKGQPKRMMVSASELAFYPTISSFVYAKMTTAGGLVDASVKLDDHDLKILSKLVAREIKARRSSKRKAAKKSS